ncbi:MAG: response regulator [Deltaproteobacteria bacterium]|nr:response regulator [Deltaproteobacteria bacterium]
MKSKIIRLFNNLFLLGIYQRQGDVEDFRKLVLVNTICFFAIIILFVIGVASYVRGNVIVGLLDFLAALLLIPCLFYLRRTGKYRVPVNIGIGIMTMLYFYMFITGGAGHTGYLWYYTYPLFTLYIMEKRDAVAANLILFIPSFIYLITIWSADAPQYTQDFTLRFIPSVLCVFVFSYLFEATRLKTQNKLRTNQGKLEKTISALRDKEAEIKRAHDELEVRIEARTSELQQSNKTLKREIEERKRSETQRKKLEAQLARAQKMEALGTLAGGVAHDLNNILSGISSYPELLLMKLPQDDPLREPLKTIHRSGIKAARIVDDLLTLSRRGAAVFETVDLQQVIGDYLKSPEFREMLSFHDNVTYKTKFSSDDFNINGSMVHLSKTVMNLITNAAEAMPAGGPITISLERVTVPYEKQSVTVLKDGAYIKLTVADEGTGIAPEALDHIFEPFFTTKKMGRSGTGLGMAVVWGTVKDHNGQIDVKSLAGRGTTFELLFPAAASKQPHGLSPPSTCPEGRNEFILVVDDVFEQREIAAGILETLGYSVRSLSSGEAAVAYLQDNSADLILLDMTMEPGMNGLETYRRILQFRPDQRVIIASGFSESDLIQEALQLGAWAYLRKPYSVASIARAVADALCP